MTNDQLDNLMEGTIPKGINNMPMGPIAMMRNQLELPGGTKAEYKSEEWANSIKFWQEYAVLKSI